MMKRIFLFVTMQLAVVFSVAAQDEPKEPSSAYEACSITNANVRQSIENNPKISEFLKRFTGITADQSICECIKETEAQPNAPKKLNDRYMYGNAVCLPKHINEAFPKICPSLFNELPDLQSRNEIIEMSCACSAEVYKKYLTYPNMMRFQKSAYRMYLAKVADRKNGTDTAKKLPKEISPLDAAQSDMNACIQRYANTNRIGKP